MRRGRVLALDYGARNIGLARSDESGLIVEPLPSIPHRSIQGSIAILRALVAREEIESLVIGMPWNMDGSIGPAAEAVRSFARAVQRELALPVHEVDERLSTLEAEELWKRMNRRQQRKYRTADSLAAALILERYLQGA